MTRTSVSMLAVAAVAAGALALPPVEAQPSASSELAVGADRPDLAQRGRGRGAAQDRKVVLAWADTRNGVAQHASVSHALAVIERLGYESGAYDTFIRTDSHIIAERPLRTTGEPASGGPSLANVDAIFFLGHRDVPIDAEQQAALLAFVRSGKGFVAAHTATTAMLDWPEFGGLLGGRYDGHPWGTSYGTVINEDPEFPATKHLPATFNFTDEFYQSAEFSRERSRVLLRLDVSSMEPRDDLTRADGDFPLAWAHEYGEGRVFYSALGHADSTWDNPDVYRMYFEALKWSMGLTEGDATPRPFGGGR